MTKEERIAEALAKYRASLLYEDYVAYCEIRDSKDEPSPVKTEVVTRKNRKKGV